MADGRCRGIGRNVWEAKPMVLCLEKPFPIVRAAEPQLGTLGRPWQREFGALLHLFHLDTFKHA